MIARLVVLEQAEAAIDVDKLSDHRQVEDILRSRHAAETAAGAGAGMSLAGISIFDLDRTLTHRPTFTAMLVYAAWHLSPLRLLLAPAVVAAMLAYKIGLIPRRRVKEIEQALLLGSRVSRSAISRLADRFAARLDARGISADGRARIAAERAGGRRIMLATAATASMPKRWRGG